MVKISQNNQNSPQRPKLSKTAKMGQSDQNSIIARSLAKCCLKLFGLSAAGAKAGAETTPDAVVGHAFFIKKV